MKQTDKKTRAASLVAQSKYEQKKEAARERSAAVSISGRDIAPLPKITDPARRAKCGSSLLKFCETYFPDIFYLGWSTDHHEVIERLETAILKGGLFSLAMPRGTGKTTLNERAALWAVLYGYRKFVVVIGASEDAALELLDTMKRELEENALLFEDFPEVCYPIRKLEGVNNRAAGQLLNGMRTQICWSGSEIALPTVEGSPASGATIVSVGITGRIRGMKRHIDGRDCRPEMVLIDDPQTRESAESPEQCKKRLRTIQGDILGLAGPGRKISGVMPCTVIRPGDVADEILDAEKNPEWCGKRLKLLRKMPDKLELWDKYREISVESFRMYGDNRDATEYYRANQSAMDAGAIPSWPERFNPDEISAIQFAMNLYFKDQAAFFAEYQNTPEHEESDVEEKIREEDILSRLNNRKRATVPLQADALIMFIDVQKNLLFFTVCAFSENFSCWVIDYGTFPDQKRKRFTLSQADPTYSQLFPGAGLEGAIYQALQTLTTGYLERDFLRDDGSTMRISRAIIDSGWGLSTNTIYQVCRESRYAALLLPGKGIGIGAASKPITEYRKQPGDKIGYNWWIPGAVKKRTARLLEYDTNFWKSFFRERLFTSPGDPGSFSIFGSEPERHRMFAEQLASESSIPTAGRGRKVDIWKLSPGKENHYLDCIVGCMVGASVAGCVLNKTAKKKPVPEERPKQIKPSSAPKVHTLGKVHTLKNG